VLVALSNKKFLGETLDVDKDGRLEATLAVTALAAWQGARMFRAHQVAATRRCSTRSRPYAAPGHRRSPAAASPEPWDGSGRAPPSARWPGTAINAVPGQRGMERA
jgi:hypothetical protein